MSYTPVKGYWQGNAVANAPDLTKLTSQGYPANGDPSKGQPATIPGAGWYYWIDQAIRSVITASGKTCANPPTADEFLEALKSLGWITNGSISSAKLNLTDLVDSSLSATSTKPVQNKVVKSAVDTLTTAVNAKLPLTGGNITGSLKIGNVEVVPVANNAAAHNAIYRGIDLTTKYTEAQISAKIQAGDFSDLFIGDYIPKTLTIDGTSVTANWVIAHFNYYMKMGWTADGLSSGFAVTVPHVVLVPDRNLISAKMNDTNTTEGGYLGSAMHTTTIPKITTALQNGFGSSHIISFASYLSNTVNTSLASMAGCGWTGATTAWGCAWTKVECRLMSEQMVYGSAIMSSSGFDAGEAKQQLALFALNPLATNVRADWWLSSVASSASFAIVDSNGVASAGGASGSLGVRPFFLYH